MKNNKMTIYKLKKSEINKIIELHKHSIVPVWKKFGIDYNLEGIRNYLRKNFKKEKFFGIAKNGKLIGCGSISFNIPVKDEIASIGLLLVDEKEQGKGCGKLMIQFLEDYARKKRVKAIELEVVVGNKAYGFYRHSGYKDYKIKMRKKLK
jgi:GNAT superfamily N-acetyltransferase